MSRLLMIVMVVLLAGCSTNTSSSQSLSNASNSDEKRVEVMNQQLIALAEKGDVDSVLKLLQDGVDINTTDERGRTAVMAATYKNKVETVKALIQKGADINIRDENLNNVLLYAGAEGLLDIVKLAIDSGADPMLTNRFGGTALIPASERGHVEVVQELLSRSAIDVNHINNLHWTALLEAVILGNGGAKHQKIVQLLVNHGADVNIADGNGVTPLMHARQQGFQEIVDILIEAGA